ncbi:MAG: FixH family protein [Archangium sp.]|nr:FixH family protein [Archangium sp.]
MKLSFVPVLLSLVLLACGPAQTAPPVVKPTQLAVASAGAVSVELLTFSPLVVGQNRVFYRVTRDGAPVAHAEVVQRPVMQMTSMKHGCPVRNPDPAPDADGLQEGLIIFTMPGSELEQWTLGVDVGLEPGVSERVNFGPLSVGDSLMKKVLTREGKKIVLTLGYPDAPHVGSNPVVVSAHQAKDAMMMEFVTVDDLVFTLTPEMPSMGHGAAGSVNPERGEDGLYRGSVVFSMAGDWVVHLGVAANDAVLGTFDFSLDL